MRIRRLLATAGLSTALALGATAFPTVASTATAAPTADCTSDSIFLDGAKAYYQECFDGARTRVKGWVEDTDADGTCAYLIVNMDNGYFGSWKACPKWHSHTGRHRLPGCVLCRSPARHVVITLPSVDVTGSPTSHARP